MGKLDIEAGIGEGDDFESEAEVESLPDKITTISKDMRRRLEDRLDDVRLSRELREYDFRDI